MAIRKRRPRVPIIGGNVLQIWSYIDTVHLLNLKRIPAEAWDGLLQELNRDDRKRRLVPNKYPSKVPGYKVHKTSVHQPSRRVMELINSLVLEGKVRIVGVDIALDLTTATHEYALALQDRVELQLLLGPRTDEKVRYVGDTAYYASRDKRKGVTTVLYSDLLSKCEDSHCLHIEARILGVEALRSANLATAPKLVQFDAEKFWAKHLLMRTPPSVEQLKRRLVLIARRKGEIVAQREVVVRTDRLIAASSNPRGALVAQSLRTNLRSNEPTYGLKSDRLFRKESNYWMLPMKVRPPWWAPKHRSI